MKNFIFTILTALFLSCSSDSNSDQSNPTTNDNMVGKWKLSKRAYFDSSNNLLGETSPDACEGMTIREYKSNNTSDGIYYSDNTTP